MTRFACAIAAMMAAASAVPGAAAVLAENRVGTQILDEFYWGQSFTTIAGPGWTNITFNFYGPGGVPVATGTGYLFAAPYAGTAGDLASGGALAAGSSNGSVWSFAPGFKMAGATTYYFYGDTPMTVTGVNVGYAGNYFLTSRPTWTFRRTSSSINFTLTGAAVPEPASWAVMIAGFGMIGAAARRRRAIATA